MEGPSVGTVVEAVERALSGAGSRAVSAYLDEGTLLHVPGSSGLAGDYQGRDAICGLLDRMTTASAGTLHFETLCTTTRRDGCVRLCGRVSGRRSQRRLATTAALEAIVVGPSIREAWLTCSDQRAWDAFWS